MVFPRERSVTQCHTTCVHVLLVRLDLNLLALQAGAFLSSLLVPEGGGKDLGGVTPVLELLHNLGNLIEKSLIQRNGLQTKVAELSVGNIKLILGSLLTGVGEHVHLNTGLLGNKRGNITDSAGLSHLVEDLHALSGLGGVVNGNFNAAGGVGNMDEGTGLSSGTVDGQRNAHGSLHKETVEDGAVISVVIETVDKALVLDRLGGVGAPHNALVKVGDAEVVVLLVELPDEGVKALGGVVDGSGVGGMEDVGLAAAGEGDIDVALGNFSARGTVAVNAHGSEMDNVSIDVGIHDGTAKVVGARDIVVDSVALGLGVLHRVGGGALLGEVDDGVGLLVLDELNEEVVILGNIEVDELHLFAGYLLPGLDTDLLFQSVQVAEI